MRRRLHQNLGGLATCERRTVHLTKRQNLPTEHLALPDANAHGLHADERIEGDAITVTISDL